MDVANNSKSFQQDGQLCAQHALNMLLQGEYFSPASLAEIGQQLDALEQNQLQDHHEVSQNMDDTGYFSIQVIQMALSNVGEVHLVSINAPEMTEIKENPTMATGQMSIEGYDIFVVQGALPHCEADEFAKFCSFPVTAQDDIPSAVLPGDEVEGMEDNDLKKAIEASLIEDDHQDDALAAALAESRRFADQDDFALRQALAASVSEASMDEDDLLKQVLLESLMDQASSSKIKEPIADSMGSQSVNLVPTSGPLTQEQLRQRRVEAFDQRQKEKQDNLKKN
uniref:Ubiquitinyl hydrolase 1 n=1 Tax=Rhabditophanes sp. KR3021 TaxID=114890 RepID=A0AC35TJL8_9BILA